MPPDGARTSALTEDGGVWQCDVSTYLFSGLSTWAPFFDPNPVQDLSLFPRDALFVFSHVASFWHIVRLLSVQFSVRLRRCPGSFDSFVAIFLSWAVRFVC
jgi:hypothetical protein